MSSSYNGMPACHCAKWKTTMLQGLRNSPSFSIFSSLMAASMCMWGNFFHHPSLSQMKDDHSAGTMEFPVFLNLFFPHSSLRVHVRKFLPSSINVPNERRPCCRDYGIPRLSQSLLPTWQPPCACEEISSIMQLFFTTAPEIKFTINLFPPKNFPLIWMIFLVYL